MNQAPGSAARLPVGIAAAVVGLLLAACSTLKVSVDYDPNAPFATLRTYRWKPEAQQKAGDTLIDTDTLLQQRIMGAVEAELARKGYAKVAERPDFLVGFYFSRQRQLQEDSYFYPSYGGYFGSPFYGYWGGWYYPGYPGYGGAYVREIEEGLLAVDIVSPANGRLLWRGKTKDILRFEDTPENRVRRIQKAVAALLEDFPPIVTGR
ncbi:DUF4136 domain-containing protein [Methylotetracoccus oryzae]|uniref:DUF4136 domain-containing protein n=1 Tax=Methylotetracoccus oryzae TaxID=1919059 RepID=UPI00111A59B2|nr:DUF4136 domain-containing protein [Methylotetracoccus oryzae]